MERGVCLTALAMHLPTMLGCSMRALRLLYEVGLIGVLVNAYMLHGSISDYLPFDVWAIDYSHPALDTVQRVRYIR